MKRAALLAIIISSASFCTPDCSASSLAKEQAATQNSPSSVIFPVEQSRESQEFLPAKRRVASLVRVIRKNPTDLLSRRQLVDALIKSGSAKQAALEMQGLIKVGLRSAEDFCLMGEAYKCSGNYPGAITYYQEALNLQPTMCHAKAGLALCYTAAGYPKTGAKVCMEALAVTHAAAERGELARTLQQIKDSGDQKSISGTQMTSM